MTSLLDTLSELMGYRPAILALLALVLVVLVQNFATAPLAFLSEEQVPGLPLRGDHSLLSFRVLRTHANSVESFPAFGWALLAAIVAGAAPVWVNGLAWLFVAFRLAFWVIYYSGIGKPAGGPRTLAYVGGLVTNGALALLAGWNLIA